MSRLDNSTKIRCFKVIFKETYMAEAVERTCYVQDEEQIIHFYGLREPDIEWFRIEEGPKDEAKAMDDVCCCCICGSPIDGSGHSPYPIKETGKCCDRCNWALVIPKRLRLSNSKHDDHDKI